MLPIYASSAEQEKMNRHAYSGAGASPTSPKTFFGERRVATMGESGRGFSIRPDKYDKYVSPILRRRVGVGVGVRMGG